MNARHTRSAVDEALPAPDAARADIYAIIGRLFYGAPDDGFLKVIRQGGGEDVSTHGPLGTAWAALVEACTAADPAALTREFDSLFVGVGKSEITPFTSHYVREAAPDRHLSQLRQLLASWDLQGSSAAPETEDHVSGICDIMRHLAGDNRPLDEQRLFFNQFLRPGLTPFCEAVVRSENAPFYRCVAQFTLAFLAIEQVAFEMEGG